jgi:hypothetical protein
MSIQITKRPHTRVFSGNPVHYELYSALAASDPTVSFEVRVMFKKMGGTYSPVVSLPYSPKDGSASVDVKDILDSVLDYDLPAIGMDETTGTVTDKQTGNFYLQFREITSVNPDPGWDDSEADYECFVVKGGLNDFKYQGNNFWLNYFDVKKPFLTWQLNGRLASKDERMYLAWLCDNLTAGWYKATVYYRDGSLNTLTVPIPIASPNNYGKVVYLPVGATQLGLQALDPAQDIYYWTIQVVDAVGGTYSELFKYELDNKNDYIGITLNYRNSLGGLDSVRVRGSLEKKLDYSFTELERTITPDYFDGRYFEPQKIVSGNVEQVMYSGNIGWMKKEEQDRLRDAQQIRETWTARRQKWVPINILTKGFSLVKNDDMRWGMPIDFTLGYSGSEYYTPETVDLGSGTFTSNTCLAFSAPLYVERNDVGAPGDWILHAYENDPQNASVEFRYRVIRNSDHVAVIDWTNCDWGILTPFAIPNNTGTYSVELQAICTNSVFGKKSTVIIDTTVGAPAGGSGGGTGSGSGGITSNSYIDNQTAFAGDWILNIDGGAHVDTGNIGANNQQPVASLSPATDVPVVFTVSFSPASVYLESNGVLYTASGISSGDWIFSHVDIIDGLRIVIQ